MTDTETDIELVSDDCLVIGFKLVAIFLDSNFVQKGQFFPYL